MERTYNGITYELVKQPTPERRDMQHQISTCCDGCEIPTGECPGLAPNECCRPENLDSVWKKQSINPSIIQ